MTSRNTNYRLCLVLFGAAAAASSPSALPADADSITTLDTVVVTASRDAHSAFETPASIDTVDGDQIRDGQLQVNSSESMVRVPGLYVQNRQAYAQDLQISSRGFGARSQFGVRGIRIIADDIPATMPDGQGQTGGFDLGSADRIEVLRGPFSALYGNHSGGVVQIFSEDGPARPTLSGSFAAGSDDTTRSAVKFGGQSGKLNYSVNASSFKTDGYRHHSAARRDQFNGRFRLELDNGAKLTLVASALDQPDNQDPLGLTAAQVQQNPRQAIAAATTFNTLRSLDNTQGGLVYEQKFGAADTVRAVAYAGSRNNKQFLAIPLVNQLAASSSGGVSVIDRDFGGAGLRWTHRNDSVTVTSGMDIDQMKDARTGYLNNNGLQGALKRDEDDIAVGSGLYTQAEWQATPQWTFSGGLRASRVDFDVHDHYIAAGNGNDSGSKSFSATTQVLGAVYHVTPAVNLYASAGKSFETPTFIEMAYRPDNVSGLNFNLKPTRSNNFEIGLKALLGDSTRLNLALFRTDSRDEVVVARNSGGRVSYQNAGRSMRQGLELGIDTSFAENWNGYLAYTYLDARYRESFLGCNATPCISAINTGVASVDAGNRLPGVPRDSLYGELGWKPVAGLTMAIEARYAGRVYVNDFNSEYAGSYAIANWRIGFEQATSGWRLNEFLRIDNLFDRDYIGAVYVGDANGRFYAPAPGRSWLLGLAAQLTF